MESIGRFEIRGKLGSGAMAEVYEAYDPEINRNLAIKVLKDERAADEEYVARFVREAKAAGALSHRNIVTIFDVGEQAGTPCILMELASGQPLDVAISQDQKFSVRTVLRIGMQLAGALDYAHERGVVHRDIKPSNIILQEDGETIKITDFGIARIEDPTAAEQTVAGLVLGTPQYMSPEQAMGAEVDGRSDLFSAGVILYQLLSGERPFRGQTVTSLLVQIAREDPEPLAQIAPETPVGVTHIVEKLLEKSPKKRFDNGAQLHSALEAQLRQIEESEDGANAVRTISMRNKLTAMMALGVAVLMAISVAIIQSRVKDVLTETTLDSGASLTNYIASGSALPLLEEERLRLEAERIQVERTSRSNAAIERFVKDVVNRQSFSYLHIANREGVVRASSIDSLVGETMPVLDRVELPDSDDTISVGTAMSANGEPVFDFVAPVTLRNTGLGEIRLGISQAGLRSALNTSLLLLCALAAFIVAIISASAYFLIGLLSKPLRTIKLSMDELAAGNLDVRISDSRDDEVGQVFAAFNGLAVKVGEGLGKGDSEDPDADLLSRYPDDGTDRHAMSDEELEQSLHGMVGENNEVNDEDDRTMVLTPQPEKSDSRNG